MSDADRRDRLVLAAGPNVRIRLRVREDGPDEFRWRSDPETARFDGRPANMEPMQRFLDAFGYELAYGRTDREQFAIDKIAGTHIGSVMLYNISHSGNSAELGISLGEEGIRGQGFGREAVVLLLRWVWENRPTRSVYLHALEWNERAVRCFRGAGFDETARVLRDGEQLLRMEVRREWWLLWEMEGRFNFAERAAGQAEPGPPSGEAPGQAVTAGGPRG